MELKEFFDYKNQLMSDLLANETIVRLLDDNCELHKDKPASEYMYTQVYPYDFIPETVTKGNTFICCEVDIQKSLNKTFLQPVIYVWVFTHNTKVVLPDGGVRTDAIASEIAKVLNGSRYYGLGELDLYSAKRFMATNDFHGRALMFNAKDFNRTAPSNKPIPSNRKKG